MHYVDFGPLRERLNRTADFAALAAESGRGREAEAAADRLEEALRQAEAAIRGLDPDPLLRNGSRMRTPPFSPCAMGATRRSGRNGSRSG